MTATASNHANEDYRFLLQNMTILDVKMTATKKYKNLGCYNSFKIAVTYMLTI